MSRWAERSAAALAAAVAVTLLGGCAAVPTSGPVERHTSQATSVNSGVRVDPLPPADGASPLLVVEGFLHAMSVYQPDYAVARQYLSEAASADWHPEQGVQVYADGTPPTEAGQTVVLQAQITGQVDSTGAYRPGPNSVQPHNFQVERNAAGQWRITHPPEGLLVSRYVFTTSFVPVTLHFLDSTGSVLVPEPRFFAAGDQAMAAAVEAQLAGPSAWLAPAVRKVDTTGVTVGAVTLDASATARVALGGTADHLAGEQRRVLLAEIAYTLSGFGQVAAIEVQGGGQPWRDDAGQARVRRASFSQLAPAGANTRMLYLVRDHRIERVADPGNWSAPAPVDVALTRPEQLAVSGDLAQFAATTGGGTLLQRVDVASGKPKDVRAAPGLLRPAFARNGELWSPAAASPSALQVYKGDQRVRVTIRGVPHDRVLALALSPDGVRVAMVLRRGSTYRVGLARVERSGDGITVDGWRTIDLALNAGGSAEPIDVGWISDTALGVLRTSSGTATVMRASEDGATATDIGPSEASDLRGLAVVPETPAIALGANGNLYRFDSEFNWNLTITGVDAVAYTG